MQFVNDDDMDELFRKAGEHYPLETGGADWSKVSAALAAESGKNAGAGKDRRRFLWLLLLLPFALLCNRYVSISLKTGNGAQNEISRKNTNTDVVPPQQPEPGGQQSETNAAAAGTESRNAISPVPHEKPMTPSVHNRYTSGEITDPAKQEGSRAKGKRPRFSSGAPVTGKYAAQAKLVTAQPGATAVPKDLPRYQVTPSGAMTSKDALLSATRRNPSFHFPDFVRRTNLVNETDPVKIQNEKMKRFYAGLMGGVDATVVRLQKMERFGYSAGVLAGYRVNKKWSVEGGFFLAKKAYYSEGEYFNTSKIPVPAYIKINEVSGDCTMWEVPLTLRYTTTSSAKRSFFANVGVSSYFMKKEYYDYAYYNMLTNYYGERGWSYDTPYKHYAAALHLSGGITRKLGKVGDLRVEPYLKLPLRGVGTGSLALQSAGIMIGVTRPVF